MASGKKVTNGDRPVMATFLSAHDMTSNRYGIVQLYPSNTVATLTQTADTMGTYHIGIQANLPLSGSGQEIQVCMHGIQIVKCGEAIVAGKELIAHTNSSLVFAATGTVGTGVATIIGMALESSSAANELISAYIYRGGLLK